jgi:glycosyltransferase involved in cell wall biosynthesis
VRRPTLAVLSPLPPSWSGIADYTARLLPHLAEEWEVVTVIPDGEAPPRPDGVACPVVHAASWGWIAGSRRIDRLLVCLGNSRYHTYAPAILADVGGVVLAHDVRMTALQCLLAAASTDPHHLSAVVTQRHGPELGRIVRAVEERIPVAQSFVEVRRRLQEVNALLLQPSVVGAHAVLVHSETAARLARLDLSRHVVPVHVVPFGHPDTVTENQRRADTIATFGMIEPEKQPEVLLRSFALVGRSRPDLRLRFVGPIGPVMADRLRRLAADEGIASAVSIIGRADKAGYDRHLAETTLAVQLRSVVNGEASAAIADCLSHGVPVVATGIGAQSEIPRTVIAHSPPTATPDDLATSIERLLRDPKRLDEMSAAASDWARSHSFKVAAMAISEELRRAPDLRL